jgi:hypothetical protein
MVGYTRLPWLSGPIGATYAAALGLVAIQVGMGILLKISQKSGTYEFSRSSSVTLSEFFKMLLSTIFFYRECRKRNARNVNPSYTALPTSERGSFGEAKEFSDERTNGNRNGHAKVLEVNKDAKEPYLDLRTFWECCRNEVSRDTRYGFAHLALFYALINNTVSEIVHIEMGFLLTIGRLLLCSNSQTRGPFSSRSLAQHSLQLW